MLQSGLHKIYFGWQSSMNWLWDHTCIFWSKMVHIAFATTRNKITMLLSGWLTKISGCVWLSLFCWIFSEFWWLIGCLSTSEWLCWAFYSVGEWLHQSLRNGLLAASVPQTDWLHQSFELAGWACSPARNWLPDLCLTASPTTRLPQFVR